MAGARLSRVCFRGAHSRRLTIKQNNEPMTIFSEFIDAYCQTHFAESGPLP